MGAGASTTSGRASPVPTPGTLPSSTVNTPFGANPTEKDLPVLSKVDFSPVINRELEKPSDGSDLLTEEDAIKEVIRLRSLLHNCVNESKELEEKRMANELEKQRIREEKKKLSHTNMESIKSFRNLDGIESADASSLSGGEVTSSLSGNPQQSAGGGEESAVKKEEEISIAPAAGEEVNAVVAEDAEKVEAVAAA